LIEGVSCIMRTIKPFDKITCMLGGILITLSVLNLSLPSEATQRNITSDLPYDIHLNWQHDSSTTMTVVLETTTATIGSMVKYGLDTSYDQIATGTIDNQGTNGLIHIVELTGLTPDTTYHYICGDDNSGWSTDSTFITAPTGPANFVFCVLGDSRDNPMEFTKIVGKINVINPVFRYSLVTYAEATIKMTTTCGSRTGNNLAIIHLSPLRSATMRRTR